MPTDKKFTGQRLDSTGLYYYNARYYDPTIGRFISADTIVPNPANPQCFNRYSYCLNNPLKYTDPSGRLSTNPSLLPHSLKEPSLFSWHIGIRTLEYRPSDHPGTLINLPFMGNKPLLMNMGGPVALVVGGTVIIIAYAVYVLLVELGLLPDTYIDYDIDFESSLLNNICGWIKTGGKRLAEWVSDLFATDKSRKKSVNSQIAHILKHQGNIQNSPGDPSRHKWEEEIRAAIVNIANQLNKMGPKARQEMLELLKSLNIHLP